MTAAAAIDPKPSARGPAGEGQPFTIEMVQVGARALRVGRHAGRNGGVPLLMFTAIGGNIELRAPIARELATVVRGKSELARTRRTAASLIRPGKATRCTRG